MSHILKSESAASFVFTPTSPWFQLFPLCLLHPPPPPPPPLFSFSFFFVVVVVSPAGGQIVAALMVVQYESQRRVRAAHSQALCVVMSRRSQSVLWHCEMTAVDWKLCVKRECVCVCVCVCECVCNCTMRQVVGEEAAAAAAACGV